jgi:hypothetical protein
VSSADLKSSSHASRGLFLSTKKKKKRGEDYGDSSCSAGKHRPKFGNVEHLATPTFTSYAPVSPFNLASVGEAVVGKYHGVPRVDKEVSFASPQTFEYLSDKTFHWDAHFVSDTSVIECTWDECNFRCSDQDDLEEHGRIHTAWKPLLCPCKGCNYRTATSASLESHGNIHTSVDPSDAHVDDDSGWATGSAFGETPDTAATPICVTGCTLGEVGDMIGCDSLNCSHGEWFHLACIGLHEAPSSDTWLCTACKADPATVSGD